MGGRGRAWREASWSNTSTVEPGCCQFRSHGAGVETHSPGTARCPPRAQAAVSWEEYRGPPGPRPGSLPPTPSCHVLSLVGGRRMPAQLLMQGLTCTPGLMTLVGPTAFPQHAGWGAFSTFDRPLSVPGTVLACSALPAGGSRASHKGPSWKGQLPSIEGDVPGPGPDGPCPLGKSLCAQSLGRSQCLRTISARGGPADALMDAWAVFPDTSTRSRAAVHGPRPPGEAAARSCPSAWSCRPQARQPQCPAPQPSCLVWVQSWLCHGGCTRNPTPASISCL